MNRRPLYRLPALGAFAAFAILGYLAGRWNGQVFSLSIGWKTSQFFFSYQELGFVKRGLIGTLLHPFPALLSPAALYIASWLLVLGFAVMLSRLFASAAGDERRADSTLLLLVCAASPAMFQRQGFDIGRFDVLEMMIALASFSAIASGRLLLVGFISSVALLIHEAYAVIHLPLVLAFYARYSRARTRADDARLVVMPALTFFALFAFARYTGGLDALVAHYRNDPLFLKATGGTVDPDAVAVLVRGLRDNLEYNARMFVEKRAIIHVPLIIAWGALMVSFAVRFFRLNQLRMGLTFYACFTPLLLNIIACDYYRWVALTTTNLFLLMFLEGARLTREGKPWRTPRGTLTWILLATTLLGPISNTKSFPFVFSLLERVYPGLVW